MLTLALMTIVVLTVASLALMLWSDAPPAPRDERTRDDEGATTVEDDGEDVVPSPEFQ